MNQMTIDFSTGEVLSETPFKVQQIPAHVQQVHERALLRAKNFKNAQGDLVSSFEDMDQCRGYLYYDVTSLTAYGIEVLGLCEGTSANLVAIIRKGEEFPNLKAAVQSGEVTISKARKIASVITKESENDWIELAKTKSSRVVEKEIARANPEALILEKMKYKTAERIEMSLGISEELADKFNRVKDLLAQKTSKFVSSEEALEALVNEFIEKHDPIKKAERAEQRAEKKSLSHEDVKPVPGRVLGRITLPASIEHKVNLRDQHQCTYVYSNGRRCGNRRWLDIHHIKPVSEGGTNEISNLTILCSAHHRVIHRH